MGWREGNAAGYVSEKSPGVTPGEQWRLEGWSGREVRGMRGVAVK